MSVEKKTILLYPKLRRSDMVEKPTTNISTHFIFHNSVILLFITSNRVSHLFFKGEKVAAFQIYPLFYRRSRLFRERGAGGEASQPAGYIGKSNEFKRIWETAGTPNLA
jgi:hypothetical protein